MGNFSGVPLVQPVHAASPCCVLQHRELLQHLFWCTLPAVLWPAAPQVPPSLSGRFREGPQGDISDRELPSRWLPGKLRDGVSARSFPGPPQGKCSAQSANVAHSHAGVLSSFTSLADAVLSFGTHASTGAGPRHSHFSASQGATAVLSPTRPGPQARVGHLP